MQIESLSAIVFTSPDPDRLADFYRTRLGIPFVHESHGPMKDHIETWIGDVHVAIRKGSAHAGGGVSPTFRVKRIDEIVSSLARAGVAAMHKVADIGEGKRLASFRDPDGNVFRLIEIQVASEA